MVSEKSSDGLRFGPAGLCRVKRHPQVAFVDVKIIIPSPVSEQRESGSAAAAKCCLLLDGRNRKEIGGKMRNLAL
jgi:hypothetical protein